MLEKLKLLRDVVAKNLVLLNNVQTKFSALRSLFATFPSGQINLKFVVPFFFFLFFFWKKSFWTKARDTVIVINEKEWKTIN